MKRLFTASILLLYFLNSNAQWVQMNDTLLRGGFVANDKHMGTFANDSVVILATQTGMFRSEDQGIDWELANAGLVFSMGPCAIAKFNDMPFTVIDYNSIHYSADNGRTWIPAGMTGISGSAIGSLSMLFGVDQALYVSTGATAFKSTDGNNWSSCGNVYPIGSDSLVYNQATGSVENYAGVSTVIPLLLGGIPSWDNLYMSPNGTVLYGFAGGAVYTFDVTSGAPSWTFASNDPVAGGPYTGFGVTYPFTFGGCDSALFITICTEFPSGKRTTRMFRSADQAQTWSQVTSGVDVPVIFDLKQLDSNTVLMNDIIGNILVSDDNGVTWQRRDSHFICNYLQNMIVMDNSLLLKPIKNIGHRSVKGILKSDDNGLTWHVSNNGLTLLADFEYDSSKVYGNFDFLFKSGNTAYCGRQPNYFARSYDEGDNWTSVALPAGDMVLWFQGDENTFFVVMDIGGGVLKYYSTNDDGNTWLLAPSIGTLGGNPMQVFGVNDTLLAPIEGGGSGVTGVPRYYMKQSTDNGATWTDISGTEFLGGVRAIDATNGGGYYIPLVDFDYSASRFMAVLTTHDVTNSTTYYTGPTYDSVYFYDPSGGWTNLNATGLPPGLDITAIEYAGGSWNIASDSGMFVSTDGGLSWTSGTSAFAPSGGGPRSLSSDGLEDGMHIITLKVRNSDAFISTSGNGCWSVGNILGVESEEERFSGLTVYPNPSNGLISFQTTMTKNNCYVAVYDLMGKLVLGQKFGRLIGGEKRVLDLTELSRGIYLLQISSDEGVEQEKMVISR